MLFITPVLNWWWWWWWFTVKRSEYGIPTLLHFAAQYGLTDLCCSVLDTPGSLAAFHIENKDGLDPAQIADKEGFHELASFIRMFVVSLQFVIAIKPVLGTVTKNLHFFSDKKCLSGTFVKYFKTIKLSRFSIDVLFWGDVGYGCLQVFASDWCTLLEDFTTLYVCHIIIILLIFKSVKSVTPLQTNDKN